jgi:hypothetical protein
LQNKLAVIGFIPLIVISAVLGAYLELSVSSTASPPPSSLSTGVLSAQTINASLGLELVASLNSTEIPSEEAIDISGQVNNVLMNANNLTASSDWAIPGLSAGSCDSGNSTNKLFFPIGLAIFRGNYGLNNLSGASPLSVWAAISCPVDFAFNGTTIVGDWSSLSDYSLLPGSDNGSQSGYIRTSQSLEESGVFPTELNMSAQFSANSGTGFRQYNSLLSAEPANYTVAVGDEWGQLVLLHFSVVASNNLPVYGFFLAASGGCSASGYPVPCFASDFSQAFIFNCAGAAATAAGCEVEASSGAGSPQSNYTITIWYPKLNQTGEPTWANCEYSVKGDGSSPFGYCFKTNSTAFVFSGAQP